MLTKLVQAWLLVEDNWNWRRVAVDEAEMSKEKAFGRFISVTKKMLLVCHFGDKPKAPALSWTSKDFRALPEMVVRSCKT